MPVAARSLRPDRRRAPAALVTIVVLAAATVLAVAGTAVAGPVRSAPPADGYDAAAAQRFVTDYTARHGLPGAAYVVVRDGRPVTSGGSGRVSATTRMSIGSLSKSITAFAVLQLVDRGAVGLDDPVTDHLPDFAVRGADPATITVWMLLSHTSGLSNPLVVTPTGSLAGDVAAIAGEQIASPPGETYRYSNLNYRTLALLVQVVSGQDFDTYLRDRIFTPLGMDDTTSVVSVTERDGLDAGHVTAYGFALPLPELRTGVAGAGGVISTAEDLGAWLAMQQRGGLTADGTRLLSADLVTESHTRQPNAGTYGLGWQHTSTADPARIGHDGSLTRYSARQDLVPSSGYGVAVLLDSYTPTYQHPFEISTGLIDISEGRSPDVGVPSATIIDVVLGAVTVLIAGLGVRGIRRADRWALRRAPRPGWRAVLRLLPHAVAPVLALIVFVGLTAGPGTTATPLDAFGLWPAAMVLLLVAAAVGATLIVVRSVALRRARGA